SGAPDAKGTISAAQVEEIDTTAGFPVPGLGFGPGFGPGFGFGPRGAGPLGLVPHARPSGLPSGFPQRIAPPKGWGGFGFRAHGKVLTPCGSVTPAPSAPSANSGPGA